MEPTCYGPPSNRSRLCTVFSDARRVEQGLFFLPAHRQRRWPVPGWSDVHDDLGRQYAVAEISGCVAATETADLRKLHFLEAGLAYDDVTLYDSDRAYTNRLHPSRHNEDWPALGSAMQSVGEQFYHFVVETLPKVLALLIVRHTHVRQMRILLPGPEGGAAVREVVALIERMLHHGLLPTGGGHPADGAVDPFLYSERGMHHCAARLFLTPPAQRGRPSRSTLALLRRLYGVPDGLAGNAAVATQHGRHSKHGQPSALPRRRVLVVARIGVSRGNWSNLDECVTMLRARLPHTTVEAFDGIAQPGVASLSAAYSRADLVVGPHGAGLTGIIFASNGTGVLEIKTVREPMWFETISHTLGLRYRSLPLPAGSFHRSGSIAVDAAALAQAAAEMTSPSSPAGRSPVTER